MNVSTAHAQHTLACEIKRLGDITNLIVVVIGLSNSQ